MEKNFDEQFLQDLEDNLTGYRDAASLARFRRGVRAYFGPEAVEVAPAKKPAQRETNFTEDTRDAA